MPSHGEAVRQAFVDSLEVPLELLTLGSGFKAMLEFHREVKFAWSDGEWDSVSLEWDRLRGQDVRSGGFLGLFQQVTQGEVTGYSCLVSRSLDELDEDGGFVVLSVKFEYDADADLEAAFEAAPEDGMLDSADHESLEEFVPLVFETSLFKTLALRAPRHVELMLETSQD
jgi:hypothetical protein